jgi:hypothetical protein
MRPTIVRALTAALATAGTAGAIALPTLTLGAAKPPASHMFAVPVPATEVVIQADRFHEQATARPAGPAAPTPAQAPAPAVAPPPRDSAPAPAALPVPPVAEPVPAAVPNAPPPAPSPAPQPAPPPPPQPTPTPEPLPQPQPAPAPAARMLASVVVQEQPIAVAEDAAKKHKQHKDKRHKEKPKHDKPVQRPDPPPAPPQAGPPVVTDPVIPVEPAVADLPEQAEDGPGKDGKEHGNNGKGHDKKN